ncbi:MAG TPA: ABC transporter permease [Streptosporangiaceae bacterium]|jgi:ABC transporter DrrB family efflux protein|nr:ABC transporter permease [Streptosporangiaceae bacterium]
MTTATISQAPRRAVTRLGNLRWLVSDVAVLARRSLARIAREPETLMDVTIQPILFVLLFAYVFGGAIALPGGGSYHEYLIGGMLAMGLAATAPGTAVALVTDMSSGLIDRFRSLPTARSAVLAGRTISDLVTQVIGTAVVAGVGLAIGWRIHSSLADAAVAFGLALLFGYAFTWLGACLGMVLRSPEAAQQMGFVLFLPLTFVSNAFVPTQAMPGWLQPIAEWNPMSAVAAASRHLFGNPNPAASVQVWPMQHPELAVLGWSVVLLMVFAPLAVHLYRRKAR